MKLSLPSDCGNSPRITIVGDFVVAWAKGDTEAVAEWLTDDLSWVIVGAEAHTGSGSATKVVPRIPPDQLEVLSIVTHGRLASCDGYLVAGSKRVSFSHAIRFAGTARSAKIAEIRSYLIESD